MARRFAVVLSTHRCIDHCSHRLTLHRAGNVENPTSVVHDRTASSVCRNENESSRDRTSVGGYRCRARSVAENYALSSNSGNGLHPARDDFRFCNNARRSVKTRSNKQKKYEQCSQNEK